MNEVKEMDLTADYVDGLARRHRWAATGVSDYPPRDPLVGQSRFFHRYKTFIHTVDQDQDNFAHVFAVEGEWGRGKSRLGHELIAQINDCSRGWYVRDARDALTQASLFESVERRDQYLGLYIRYSQLASEYQNSDNWFGFGLYKALLPLATRRFDGTIQSEIARQALRRLEPEGFAPTRLAELLQLDAAHSDEQLYFDPHLVNGLVQEAYRYLNQFGIRYVLVVLDELETVAEAATFGLEQDDAKRLDGQAIRLIGKAIKEEDPRRALPWLRYVALCSPLLGQQLREIQSVARRFELVELESNAFADVSDYVDQLRIERRLGFAYPAGLVEAAYAMSGANFGWFNVIMANVDAVLEPFTAAGRAIPDTGGVFEAVLAGSGRVARHVLDHNAIEGIDTKDQDLLALARRLLFGQLPLALTECPPRMLELLKHHNEYSEPIASRYRRVCWEQLDCRRALEAAKFQRDKDEWYYPGVEHGLNLKALMQNLRTFAIQEPAANTLLIPLALSEFKHLVGLLYSHPAAEFAADALWHGLIGTDKELDPMDATHLGPSVAMLLRLDLRYRSQQNNSMIFRDPGDADAHTAGMRAFETDCGSDPSLRARTRLTGLFRLLDRNWQYDEPPYPNKEELVIQAAPQGRGRGVRGGLLFCDGLKLHPDNQAWLAWVSSVDGLNRLHALACRLRAEDGRFPVMAFTGSLGVLDYYDKGGFDDAPRHGKDDILLYYLNSSELDVVERIGLPARHRGRLELRDEGFTTKFKSRLNGIRDFAYQAIHAWRHRLDARGLIAWPLRPGGKLSQEDRERLFKAWKLFAIEQPRLSGLHALTPEHGVDAEALAALFGRLTLSRKVLGQGYGKDEHAGLFVDLDQPDQAQARLPAFLARITDPSKPRTWTLDKARADWYWGHLAWASGLSAKTVFDDWMWWCQALHLLKIQDAAQRTPTWIQVERAELEAGVQMAENWLDGPDPGGFRATVRTLERVYGTDRIPGQFAPKGAAPQGTQTTEALEQLAQAQAILNDLAVKEQSLTEVTDLATIRERLPALLRGRSELLRELAQVRPLHSDKVTLDNVRTLRLDDTRLSLYERVERARLFAESVDRAGQTISDQAAALIEAIEADAEAQPPFPRRLFTLSFETIRNIIAGALDKTAATATQQEEINAGIDTLLHFLRSLQLDKASERLEFLGREVGYDVTTGTLRPFNEIDGYILQAFRELKTKYKTARDQTQAVRQRIEAARRVLDPLPGDYPEPDHPVLLETLLGQQQQIEESFADLEEQVDEQRQKIRLHARKGQFAAIREVPDQLMKALITQSAVLGGKVQKIENGLQAYRGDVLHAANTGLRRLINPLLTACGEPEISPLTLIDVEALSLHDLRVEIDLRQRQWSDRAETLLANTGINIARWREIAQALLDDQQPELSTTEQRSLVDRGILQVRIAFGGA
jgi:hypothetical protein